MHFYTQFLPHHVNEGKPHLIKKDKCIVDMISRQKMHPTQRRTETTRN